MIPAGHIVERMPDPLEILASTASLLTNLQHIRIDQGAIDAFVSGFAGRVPDLPAWDTDVHFHDSSAGGAERVAGWILALDALNFCFWSTTEERWRVTWRDRTSDGYFALATALVRAVEEGCPLWDPAYLRSLYPGRR